MEFAAVVKAVQAGIISGSLLLIPQQLPAYQDSAEGMQLQKGVKRVQMKKEVHESTLASRN